MASDLEQLCSYVNEKIGNIKKILSIRSLGQAPALKTTLSKIGDEIITVNELLNKFELEILYQEQTNKSLKELCASLEDDFKDVEHLKEHIPSYLPQVTATQSLLTVKFSGHQQDFNLCVVSPSTLGSQGTLCL